jgi:TFIIF-interacting CTD phosphatase-like protein
MYGKKIQSLTDLRIVLDLDSTLVHSSIDMAAFEKLRIYSNPANIALRERTYTFELIDASGEPGYGEKTPMWGIFRPHLKEFVDFMSMYFKEIYVYSAGLYKYVNSVTDIIFSQALTKPVLIYSRDDCLSYTGELVKPLTKIYNDPRATGANETNTFVLDDRDKTFCFNPYNGIKIPIYEPNPTFGEIMKEDICLEQLMYWLSLPEVMNCRDVRELDKSTIFTHSLDEYKRMIDPNFQSSYDYNLNLNKSLDLIGLSVGKVY